MNERVLAGQAPPRSAPRGLRLPTPARPPTPAGLTANPTYPRSDPPPPTRSDPAPRPRTVSTPIPRSPRTLEPAPEPLQRLGRFLQVDRRARRWELGIGNWEKGSSSRGRPPTSQAVAFPNSQFPIP